MARKKKLRKQSVSVAEHTKSLAIKATPESARPKKDAAIVRKSSGSMKVALHDYLDGFSRALDLTGGGEASGYLALAQRRNKRQKTLKRAWVRIGASFNKAVSDAAKAQKGEKRIVVLPSGEKIMIVYDDRRREGTKIRVIGRSIPVVQIARTTPASSSDLKETPVTVNVR